MCASAISFARIKNLYFGAFDPKGGAVENGIKFFNSDTCNHKPDVYGGFSEKKSSDLLKSYFTLKRD
jgi:tRNA(adenine34) deaminase